MPLILSMIKIYIPKDVIMKKIYLTLLLFPLLALAKPSTPAILGTWGGTFHGITTKSVNDAQGEIQNSITKLNSKIIVEQAQDGFCIAEFSWKHPTGQAIGYAKNKHQSEDKTQLLCSYSGNRLSLVGWTKFITCTYKGNQMNCQYRRSTNQHSSIGSMHLQKSKE